MLEAALVGLNRNPNCPALSPQCSEHVCQARRRLVSIPTGQPQRQVLASARPAYLPEHHDGVCPQRHRCCGLHWSATDDYPASPPPRALTDRLAASQPVEAGQGWERVPARSSVQPIRGRDRLGRIRRDALLVWSRSRGCSARSARNGPCCQSALGRRAQRHLDRKSRHGCLSTGTLSHPCPAVSRAQACHHRAAAARSLLRLGNRRTRV